MAAQRTPQQIATLMTGFLEGTNEWAWDDFESVPLADPFLETIRQRAIPMGPPHPNITGIHGLLAELKARYPDVG